MRAQTLETLSTIEMNRKQVYIADWNYSGLFSIDQIPISIPFSLSDENNTKKEASKPEDSDNPNISFQSSLDQVE